MNLAFLFLLLFSAPVYAAGVEVVQSAAPTSNGGTQDFTVSGFGTPVCAMFFVSYGTSAGTEATHGMLAFGFSDFTNHRAIGHATESSGGTTDTGAERNASNALVSLLSTDQSVDGTATASTITDGVRLTWADAPPSAYLVTAVMFNSSVFANCTVGTLTPAGVVDTTASVSGLGWQPDLVLFGYAASLTSGRTSYGTALNDGGVVQRSTSLGTTNGQATSDIHSMVRNDRVAFNPTELGADFELSSFDSGGFTITTRTGTSVVADLYYLAGKLATGMQAKLLTCNSPTATGSHSCTGAGFTPQAAIMSHSNVTTINTTSTTNTTSEIYGLSAFTATAAGSAALWADDGTAISATASISDTKAVRLRKDSADYMTATLSGFQSDGANFDYTATDGSAHLRTMLFFKSTAASRAKGSAIWFQ